MGFCSHQVHFRSFDTQTSIYTIQHKSSTITVLMTSLCLSSSEASEDASSCATFGGAVLVVTYSAFASLSLGRSSLHTCCSRPCREAAITDTFALRDGNPAMVPSSFVDKNTGLITANGVLAAIIQNLRTQEGVYLEIGMFEGIVAYNLVEHLYGRMFVPAEGEAGYARVISKNRRPHATRDGYLCMLPYTDSQWRKFWAIAERPELAGDSRFLTMQARSKNIDALYGTAADCLKTRDSEEWLALLADAEIPAGHANRLDDLFTDPHLRAIGFFREHQHPSEGALIAPDTPYRLNGQSLPVRQPAPRLGEHTREILAEVGYDDYEINTMTEPKL